MVIHVVQSGDTIYTIAEKYNVSVTKLVEDNGITNPENLVVGQAIVIVYPKQTYIVQDGDSLTSIANKFNVTNMQLLRNNPFLSNREVFYPGEVITISYETTDSISINAYAYPFIDREVLRKTLPYLTYLTIFNYRTIADGEIVGDDETEIIQIAKNYGVAPIMSLSTLTYQGESDIEVVNSILYNEDILDYHISEILNILQAKGYYGINISVINLEQNNRPAYEHFIGKLSSRVKEAGYLLFLTITPRIIISTNDITFEKLDYTILGQAADEVLILSYGWGSSLGPPSPSTPAYIIRALLDYAVTMIPPSKINFGLSVIGYDWRSPYIIGITRANSLSPDAAVELAAQTGSTIKYDFGAEAPYFEYYDDITGVPIRHIVWFIDGRSIDALIKFIPEYNIKGTGIWNIMTYFAQMWLVINSQYKILKVFPEI